MLEGCLGAVRVSLSLLACLPSRGVISRPRLLLRQRASFSDSLSPTLSPSAYPPLRAVESLARSLRDDIAKVRERSMKSALPCPLACPAACLACPRPPWPPSERDRLGRRPPSAATAPPPLPASDCARLSKTLSSPRRLQQQPTYRQQSGAGEVLPAAGPSLPPLACRAWGAWPPARSPGRLRGLLVFDSYADLTDSDSGGGGGEEGRKGGREGEGAKAADSFLPSLALWVRRSHYLLSSGSGEKLAAETAAGGAVEPIVEGTSGLRREGTLGSRTFTFARGTPRDPPWK